MAEGRILSKRVSKSDKVASLSSDTARMFYCMIIPWLDVEGRLEANPRLMKGDIAPLLDHITKEKIESLLVELDDAGLIILYEVDNKQYLQLVKFDENQPNLRKDREKKSLIPKAPATKKQPPAELRQESGEAPAELPHKINISKDNIREAKGTPEQPQPVDNSPVEEKTEPVKNAFFTEMEKEFSEVMTKIKAKYDYKEQLEIQNWIKSNYKGKHPQALIHTLNSIVIEKRPEKPDISISLYLDKVINLENQNYNYADFLKKQEEFKKPGPVSIGDIFAGIKLHAAHA